MKFFITGGCGFVGSNLANSFLNEGHEVVVFDNLCRRGAEYNLKWLERNNCGRLIFIRGDIRDIPSLHHAMDDCYDAVYHTAAQVAVTTSVQNPREDFEVNALGTLNVLEGVRKNSSRPVFIFTSTNKVYGGMKELEIVQVDGKYTYAERTQGIGESQPLDFHSPYGCSKGCADQYVRDYARIYGIRSVVFRMSCQYGPRQFGNEDQGWVVHFIARAFLGNKIDIYGNGMQIRDVLFIDDLVRLFKMATESIDDVAGKVLNIGGGPANVLSLLELVGILEELTGRKVEVEFGDWRPGDQLAYISNIQNAFELLGWSPSVGKTEGIRRLYNWISDNADLFRN